MTVTDSDQDRLTSEKYLAHLRFYKTVKVQLVSHHSSAMLCGTVSPLLGELRDSSKKKKKKTHYYSSCLAAGLQLITVKMAKWEMHTHKYRKMMQVKCHLI